MATVQVYYKGHFIDHKQFQHQFMILKDNEETLVWQTYDERKQVSQKKGGEVQIWFRSVGGPDAFVGFPPSGWRVWIDRIQWNQHVVFIPVAGKTVELRYQDYYFVVVIEGAMPARCDS